MSISVICVLFDNEAQKKGDLNMSIIYVLSENHLVDKSNAYMGRVTSKGTIDVQGLVDDILKHSNRLMPSDILPVLELYENAIINRLQAGYRVNTRLVNFGLSIQGTFNGPDDRFDASRHRLNITASATTVARRKLRADVQMKKGQAWDKMPNLESYFDFASQSRNRLLTPNNPGQLSGHRLKFDADDSTQGVFFIATSDGTATRASLMIRNKPADLMFMVPAGLAAGEYTLEVRTALKQNRQGIGRLHHPLTIIE